MVNKEGSFREDLQKEGYSKEEEYFYRINQELIKNRRKQLDEKRVERRDSDSAAAYWMKCPKCGNQMKEINFSGIHSEECTVCHGIFFDQGEFETLLEAKRPKHFLKGLLNRVRAKISEFDTHWRP
ncbi:MAG: zf-TFIIB domain-containing protein [Bdellovibrionia bacterium]